jgi:hypothetical protein
MRFSDDVIRFSRPADWPGDTVQDRPARCVTREAGGGRAFVSPRVSYIISLVARRRHHAIKSDRPSVITLMT